MMPRGTAVVHYGIASDASSGPQGVLVGVDVPSGLASVSGGGSAGGQSQVGGKSRDRSPPR